jgi:hypothetical protein
MTKEYICTLKYIMAIEKFDLSCDFTKKHSDKFFIQMNINVLEKKICWKINFNWKMTRNMLEAFVLKSILYVYQNVKCNQRKIASKIYPKIIHFSCLK